MCYRTNLELAKLLGKKRSYFSGYSKEITENVPQG